MIAFQSVTLKDRALLHPFLLKSVYRNCDFSFANIYCWIHRYNTTYAIRDGFLFLRFYSGNEVGYMFPLGDGNIKDAIDVIFHDAAESGEKSFLYMSQEMFKILDGFYPQQFKFHKNRDWFEYIYTAESLISLSGKKLQPKRNHINKFKRSYPAYEYLPITQEITGDCLDLYECWCKESGGCMGDDSLAAERLYTQKAFLNFDELGLMGGAIRVDGKIIAYSFGQPLSVDTFGVHAEKSLYEIEGGFSIINQQFAEHVCAKFVYINREEDMGLESLRQSKLSYHPAFLLEKGYVTIPPAH